MCETGIGIQLFRRQWLVLKITVTLVFVETDRPPFKLNPQMIKNKFLIYMF